MQPGTVVFWGAFQVALLLTGLNHWRLKFLREVPRVVFWAFMTVSGIEQFIHLDQRERVAGLYWLHWYWRAKVL